METTKRVWEEGEEFKSVAELKQKWPEVIFVCRDGEYYSIYGKDAIKAAIIFNTGYKESRYGEPEKCSFFESDLEIYLPKLVRAGHRVAIIEPLIGPRGSARQGV